MAGNGRSPASARCPCSSRCPRNSYSRWFAASSIGDVPRAFASITGAQPTRHLAGSSSRYSAA
ncbi:MAG: hypothetical protein KC423_01865 [Anaerolineales bacterium]|nr:hypothetical protein [Anaerolineales bacterium]